jgi:hypothetical protein
MLLLFQDLLLQLVTKLLSSCQLPRRLFSHPHLHQKVFQGPAMAFWRVMPLLCGHNTSLQPGCIVSINATMACAAK